MEHRRITSEARTQAVAAAVHRLEKEEGVADAPEPRHGGDARYLGHRLLRPDDVRARGFFEPGLVERLRREPPGRLATPMAHNLWAFRLWSVLMCEVWARLFLDRPISSNPPERLADLL